MIGKLEKIISGYILEDLSTSWMFQLSGFMLNEKFLSRSGCLSIMELMREVGDCQLHITRLTVDLEGLVGNIRWSQS